VARPDTPKAAQRISIMIGNCVRWADVPAAREVDPISWTGIGVT